MPNYTDVSAQIRLFLLNHAGQYCETCLARGAGIDAKEAKAAFKPSKDNPYSFMPAWCKGCETRTLCVAYVGESEAGTQKQAAAALMGSKHG